ncbi:MAG TPA: DNA polymerase Y family protein [Caulobacteraceae bacterium]|jgi:protein ImuB|nr:DNA polymerase Y family protein [Caulobacteraceae bacterium]
MTRHLCVWSPSWAIDNWIRRHPSAWRGEAFALVAAERGVRRLAAVDAGAAGLGLFAGQKATDAAALAPRLVIAEAEPAADAAALTALADWCARFSPAVATDPPDGLILDITGVAHLWGGEGTMVDDLVTRLAGSGLAARAAIADSPGAAWALAHFSPDRSLAAPGGSAAALAPLPVAALRLTGADAAQLTRLGLTNIAALAALPRRQVGPRFGAQVVRRLDQALGTAGEALTFRRPPSPWFARAAFVEPISTPEDLARASGDIVQVLAARLEVAGRGGRRFDLAFHGLDGAARRLTIGLALPGRDSGAIARLFAPLIETVDPGFGIEVVTLAARDVEALAPRQAEFPAGGKRADSEDIAPLIDRLANRLGAAAVWRAGAFPSHAPERAVKRRPPLAPAKAEEAGWRLERPRPLRLFRRPEPIEVMALVPDDPPVFFRWRGLAHRVRRAEGPERLAREWWRRPFDDADPDKARDYYRVEDEAGARFWLFRDGLYDPQTPPKWWLHGLFG